jgi:uncharacterized RDD family membrane protein YckC
MASTSLVKRTLSPAWVRPEALNVTPDLLGAPLAPNGRRALAILVDVALIGVLSTTGMFWAVAGAGALAIQLRRTTPRRPLWRSVLMSLALAWLAIVAFAHGADWLIHHDDPARIAAAAREDALDEDDDAASAASAVTAAAAVPASASAAASATAEARQSARIAALEAQLAAARQPHPLSWRDALQRQLHRLGLSFGWAIAYFTLLPFWWKGQTVGKRLCGLRVVELTGKPLGLMTCFGRYGGYAAGLATGGMGFLQVLWDPNRQAVQDKLAHTVVVDLRSPRAA